MNDKKTDVVTLGIAVVDITAYPVDRSIFDHDNTPIDEVMLTPGGDAVNQALFLAGLGRSVRLSCRLGDDFLGHFLAGRLSNAGVNIENMVLSPDSSTSSAIVLVSKTGERNIICKRGSNYDFCLDNVDMDAIANTRALSIGSIYGIPKLEEAGLAEVLQHTKKSGVVTFADMGSDKKNLRLDGVKPFLPFINFFMPSETESIHLTGENNPAKAAVIFKEYGAVGVIIKLGNRGAYADIPGFCGYINPFDINAVDTTGSGDAFCAGFIHGILSSQSSEHSLRFASACGAYNALHNERPSFNISDINWFIKKTPFKSLY